jgi:hypothetical protein
MIELQYEAPNEGLAPFVSSFYRFDYEGTALKELERADRAQFRFMLRGRGHYHFAAGHQRPTWPVTIIGPTTAPVEAISGEPLTIFGWGMTPAGWASLMGSEAEKWSDEAFDARRIFGDAIMDLRQQLVDASDAKAQFKILPSQTGRRLSSQRLSINGYSPMSSMILMRLSEQRVLPPASWSARPNAIMVCRPRNWRANIARSLRRTSWRQETALTIPSWALPFTTSRT